MSAAQARCRRQKLRSREPEQEKMKIARATWRRTRISGALGARTETRFPSRTAASNRRNTRCTYARIANAATKNGRGTRADWQLDSTHRRIDQKENRPRKNLMLETTLVPATGPSNHLLLNENKAGHYSHVEPKTESEENKQ
jgi:hypothetical protein